MPVEVAHVVEALAAQGLRLTAHTRVEHAVMSAAIAATAAGSRTSMAFSDSVDAGSVPELFRVGKCFLAGRSRAIVAA